MYRVTSALGGVGETLAIVTSAVGVIAGLTEIIGDVRYIAGVIRTALAHSDEGDEDGGAVDLVGDGLDTPVRGSKLPMDLSQAKELETADVVLFNITFEFALSVLPSALPTVQNLTMQATLLLKSPWLVDNSYKFSQLKCLRLLMFHTDEDMHNILSLASFLKACPLIEKLEIHFNIAALANVLKTGTLRSLPKCRYNYLRSVCFTGYEGDRGQLELLVHVVENAPALEVLIIDRTTRRGHRMNEHSGELPAIAARRYLEGKILPSTKVEII